MRNQLNVRLPEYHIERLRQMAEDTSLSQSEVIMRLIDEAQGRHDTIGALGGIFMPLGAEIVMLESADDFADDHIHERRYSVAFDKEIGFYLESAAFDLVVRIEVINDHRNR